MFSSTGVSEVDKSCGRHQNDIITTGLLFPLHTFSIHSFLPVMPNFLSEWYPLSISRGVTQVCTFVSPDNKYRVSAEHFHEEKSALTVSEELWIEIIQAAHD